MRATEQLLLDGLMMRIGLRIGHVVTDHGKDDSKLFRKPLHSLKTVRRQIWTDRRYGRIDDRWMKDQNASNVNT